MAFTHVFVISLQEPQSRSPTTFSESGFAIRKRFSASVIRAGELAQMVERSLSMREVPGSMPGFSNHLFFFVSLLFI